MDSWKRLQEILPGGVSSPVRACKDMGIPPLIAQRAEGAYLEDIRGNRYLDFCSSWGALLFGHAHPKIIQAVTKALSNGTSFGVTTLQEADLGERIRSFFPSMERVRFVSSGTEATMSAVRVARGYTGKNRILGFHGHYHGHSDQFLQSAGSGVAYTANARRGVPESFTCLTDRIPFNDFDALENYDSQDVAAIIVEPVAINMGCVAPKPGFLEAIQKTARRLNALLIFDEVVTGFRIAPGGAQEYFNIQADITCLGKIIGGGFPLAAFGGRQDIMEMLAPVGPVYQAGTLSGNPIATAAGIATLDMINSSVYRELQEKADRFFSPIERVIAERQVPIRIQRIGSMATLFFTKDPISEFQGALSCSKEQFRQFFIALLKKGIYIPPLQLETWFLSTAHEDEMLEYACYEIISFISSFPSRL